MNYFPFHLGDYAAHTAHLEPMEDLAYRRLLDQYYLKEGPLPADIQVTAKLVRMRSMVGDVDSVLKEFFELTEDGWRHSRCDSEIEHMQDKQAKARASAAASVKSRQAFAAKKLQTSETPADENNNGRSTDVGNISTDVQLPTPTPTPTPIKKKEAKASLSAAKLPTCPTNSIVALYHEVLPELPGVRVMDSDREKAIKDRWAWVLTSTKPDGGRRAETPDQALDWFKNYFQRARDNEFLMGASPRDEKHKNWKPDIEFLMKSQGLKQVLEKTFTETA